VSQQSTGRAQYRETMSQALKRIRHVVRISRRAVTYPRWEPYELPQGEWDELGKKAGPLRNQRMLDEGKPDLVVAFPGGGGTKDMVRRAVKAGVAIHEVNRADDW